MANFDVVVDTRPMASSIDTVNGNVRGVTGAVVAMQSAVVAEQRAASKKICENVDGGFYILMKSQLSQKIAACSSTMSSKLMLMKKFRQDINHIKDVMQEDYNRICRRYGKQFDALNKALESRVHELDRPSMEIAEAQKLLFKKMRDESCSVICYEDSQVADDEAVTATVKGKSIKAIDAMSKNVNGSIVYNRNVQHILKNESVDTKKENFIPVLIVESDSMFDSSAKVSNIYVPENNNSVGKGVVANQVQAKASEFDWQPVVKEEHDFVKNSFMQKCSSAGVEERVANEMIRLFNESEWSSPKNAGVTQ
ncbi:MAG: hypothetical protein WCQ67_08810 [Treponema sp.]